MNKGDEKFLQIRLSLRVDKEFRGHNIDIVREFHK